MGNFIPIRLRKPILRPLAADIVLPTWFASRAPAGKKHSFPPEAPEAPPRPHSTLQSVHSLQRPKAAAGHDLAMRSVPFSNSTTRFADLLDSSIAAESPAGPPPMMAWSNAS